MKSVTIVIPVYNESGTVTDVLERVRDQSLPGWRRQIIVVDDGSTDGTAAKLKEWEKRVTVLYKTKNEGKGSAVRLGLTRATGDIVIIQDADLEYSPADYPALLGPFDNSQVNVVYGSRFLGPHLTTMFVYALGNKFVTFLTNIMYNTNITDMETGYKVFRRKVLDRIRIDARGFDFEPEFTARVLKRGYQIYEVPIRYFGRKHSEGKKLTWRDGVIALWTLIRCRFA
ncbi:glycosyl transferase [Candidatus Gottesmanbacteria bacterium RBG_16_52_11]|uniref:Glycosyl transferase n=1 Tax=Candidatus Gottesmanbacteria bacterium RBG_16_52_11 TaxID=1798374 RepID=A0A1F5YP60_9BACT|nr:MAG: glycosyl transferase [Candidatus Gottesmanbacteria bacterium RBG_16_52_11]